jgi:surfeit locus 1 family protein
MSRYRFEWSLWPTLAAIVGIAATAALCTWQLGRGSEKAALAERIEAANRDALITLPVDEIRAADIVWRRVSARGRFEPKYAVFIDNRVQHGVVGYHVVMPLELGASGRFVLVDRGWVAATGSRKTLPEIRTPAGTVQVTGLAVVPSRRFLELSSDVADGNVWQNLTLERYRQAMPIAIQPVLIRQENDLGDGLLREWDAPDLGIGKHYGYAFQWFALGLAILIYYLATHVRKR